MAAPSALGERMDALTDRRRIAVVPLRGVIGGAAKTQELLRTLEVTRRTPRIRAVLLDIDSPGGAATESEALFVAVRKVAAEKPVVAWFRGTGASGAYFAACGATRILSFPSAIVGSIGVISIRPVLVDALRMLGTRMVVTKTGPFKDLGAPWREPTEADEAKERELVDAIFKRFSGAVAAARGFNDEELARVTTGEVWLGQDALALGLIDGIADTADDALIEAQALAGMEHRRYVKLGQRRTVLARLGVPGAGMGPPSARWIAEIEGWLRVPQARV